MRKPLKRLLVALSGMVLFLIVLEISLRLVGSNYARLSESEAPDSKDCGTTILAIGDSVTFGIGAPRGFSYPAQLEQLLISEKAEQCYSVINRGRPGQNSTQILSMLETWLQEFHPDIVTVLIGAQNQVNYYGYRNYLSKEDILSHGWLKFHEYLDRVKVYKFVRLVVLDIQQKKYSQGDIHNFPIDDEKMNIGINRDGEILQTGLYESDSRPDVLRKECTIGSEYRMAGEFDKSHEVLLQRSEEGPLSAVCYNMIGSGYREQNQIDKAIFWFKEGIRQDPSFYDNFEEIGGIYYEKGQMKEALKWFKQGLNQAAPDTLHDQSYISISLTFRKVGQIVEAIQFFKQEQERLESKNPKLAELAGDYWLMFSENVNNDTIHAWITHDVEKVVDLCLKYNAQVVVQNYPNEPKVNHLFFDVAKKKGTFYVNHEQIFKKYISSEGRDPKAFVPDGHPNVFGYGIMAENILKQFKDNKL